MSHNDIEKAITPNVLTLFQNSSTMSILYTIFNTEKSQLKHLKLFSFLYNSFIDHGSVNKEMEKANLQH